VDFFRQAQIVEDLAKLGNQGRCEVGSHGHREIDPDLEVGARPQFGHDPCAQPLPEFRRNRADEPDGPCLNACDRRWSRFGCWTGARCKARLRFRSRSGFWLYARLERRCPCFREQEDPGLEVNLFRGCGLIEIEPIVGAVLLLAPTCSRSTSVPE